MLLIISVLLIVIACFTYAILFSKSKKLGQFLYSLNNKVEASIAGLSTHNISIDEEDFVYLANNNEDKPILLLLHGFSADKNIWLKFAKHARKDYHVVIPDLLGHGEIPYNSTTTYSSDEQSRYVSKLIVKLANKHNTAITIVGNSMGGMIAAQLIKKWEHKPLADVELKQTVLLDPAGAYSDFAKEMHRQQHNPFLHLTEESVFGFYKQAMHKPPFMPPSVYSYIAKVHYLEKHEQYKHMFSDFFNIDYFFKDKINHSTNPPLIIWGEKDSLLPVEDASVWEELLSTDVQILPQIGHMPMVECPKMTYMLMQNAAS